MWRRQDHGLSNVWNTTGISSQSRPTSNVWMSSYHHRQASASIAECDWSKNFTFSCRVWPHLSCHTVSLSTNRQLFSSRISTPSCYLSQNNFIFIAAIRLLMSQSPNTVMKSVYELWIWRYPQWCSPRLTHLWNVRHMYRSAYFPKLAQSSRELCN